MSTPKDVNRAPDAVTTLRTADCQKFLATDPRVEKIVRESYDPTDWNNDPQCATIRKNCSNPKKWVRRTKYNVGSKTDMEGGDTGGGLALKETQRLPDGIVREFTLRDTDAITILLVERDGQIVYIDDLTD